MLLASMAPMSQRLEPSGNPERFNSTILAMTVRSRSMAYSVGVGVGKRNAFWTRYKLISFGVLAFVMTVAVVSQSGETAGASSQGTSNIDVLPGIASVRLSILKAESPEELNQNLVSQLESEANFRFVDPCASEPGESNDSPAAVACKYGDTNAQEVMVLYGDSYVEQWLPAFDALGKQYHFKESAYVRYGCPLRRGYRTRLSRLCRSRMCKVPAERNRGDKRDVPPPSLTLLAELQLNIELAANGSTMSFKTWANGIRSTLKQLDVKPLGVLIGTPIANNNPGTCLSAHLTHIQVCATPTSEAYSIARVVKTLRLPWWRVMTWW